MGSDVHDDDTSLERPKIFGDYYLLTTLARGGMGSIHLAKRVGFRPDIQRFCVVKKLRRGHATASELRRFHDEARVVVTLNHRALCHVFDVGVVDDEHYLAMELIEGVNLQKATGHTTFEPGLALYILDEVLDALEYAHGHKDPSTGRALMIVHRDVSPHNVMLSFQGGVKLIDFGLVSSTLKSEQTVGGVVVGKLEYMSPEQARGEALDARSDVYAAAVILYELLSGRRFYGELSKNLIMMELVEGTYVPAFDGIAPALVPALLRALAGDRDQRTPSCASFQAELSAAGGPRASSRELRDALQRALPNDKARLEALVRGFRDVGLEPLPHDANTQVTHIARSDEPHASVPSTAAVDEATRTVPLVEREVTTPAPTRLPERSQPARSGPARTAARSLWLALAVAMLSGAAIIGIWLFVRGAPRGESDGVAVPLVARAVQDAGVLELVGARPANARAAPRMRSAEPAEPAEPDEPDAREPRDEATLEEDDDVATDAATKRPRKPKRARPPNVPLPDLAAHLDYLGRWCAARVPCARPVLAARSRIPLLDVVGLRALRRDAEACVIECRR